MSTIATSLKLPGELKVRVDKLAARTGKTTHAFLLAVIEEQIARSELAEKFLRDAIAADVKMQASGKGYMAEDVHAYVTAKVAGKKARKPRLKSWRK
jgi:predicted transcriptional regulator